MRSSTGSARFSRPALAPVLVLALSACSAFTGGSEPGATTAAAQAPQAGEQIDVRRYIGPDYCPEIRIREGTEVARAYERGHEDEPAHVIWQASVGKTARECLYDEAGNLTLRIGVSGRVIAGPRGTSQTVSLPLRLAVVKHKEAVLASELYRLSIALPTGQPTVFTEVREITVPAPGDDRDYIIYAGFDEKGENLLDPGAARVAAAPKPEPVEEIVEVEEPAPPPPRRAAPPAQPAQPNVLPTPSGGFVLPGG